MGVIVADSSTSPVPVITPSPTSNPNSTMASLLVEASSTILNNLTSTIHSELVKNLSSSTESSVISSSVSPSLSTEAAILGYDNSTIITNPSTNLTGGNLLEQAENGPGDDADGHKNPELKYFSTVIIIFMGLAILIVPVFCFVGVVCARARVFRTVREAAGKGWGFSDTDVPYAEFGSDDYSKDTVSGRSGEGVSSNRNRNCDVKVLVADDNCIPSNNSSSVRGGTGGRSFLQLRNSTSDDEDDIATLPPTFVHS